jgi:folylpolyglutamate synthase/dihydropteroate synthase
MDGPLNSVVGDWTGFECRDDIYVNTLYPEIRTDEIYGKPHNEYMCVRVAGTNGKGSTTRMIAWTLQEQGYDVGMMSNISTTEKLTDTIKYNGNDIPESKLKDICMDVASVATEDIEPYGIRTIAAFEWFRQKNVDIAVIESGVCSQYDATNIVDPSVYAVTNIGLDYKESVDGCMIDDFAAGAKGSECVVTNCSNDTLKTLQDLCDTEINLAPSRARLMVPKDDLSYDCELQKEILRQNSEPDTNRRI